MNQPSPRNLEKMWKYARNFARKTGTCLSPVEGVTEAVLMGLAAHMDEFGKPLCPCNFYPDKSSEIRNRRWLCACDEMQKYKYCHCMLFVREDGMPITEHLPEGHEGREMYGEQADPAPHLGRAMREVPSEGIRDWHSRPDRPQPE